VGVVVVRNIQILIRNQQKSVQIFSFLFFMQFFVVFSSYNLLTAHLIS
jgi:hypothetical protein